MPHFEVEKKLIPIFEVILKESDVSETENLSFDDELLRDVEVVLLWAPQPSIDLVVPNSNNVERFLSITRIIMKTHRKLMDPWSLE